MPRVRVRAGVGLVKGLGLPTQHKAPSADLESGSADGVHVRALLDLVLRQRDDRLGRQVHCAALSGLV